MERSTDKLFIYFACLALLAMRALGDAGAADVAAATAAAHGGMLGIGATDVVVALAAVSAAALNEALPTRTRPLAPIALGVIAIFSPTGFLFPAPCLLRCGARAAPRELAAGLHCRARRRARSGVAPCTAQDLQRVS